MAGKRESYIPHLDELGGVKGLLHDSRASEYQDARYKARLLLNTQDDPVLYLYFHFASPFVTEFDSVNFFFKRQILTQKKCTKSW